MNKALRKATKNSAIKALESSELKYENWQFQKELQIQTQAREE